MLVDHAIVLIITSTINYMLVKYPNDLLFVVIKKQCSYIGSTINSLKIGSTPNIQVES